MAIKLLSLLLLGFFVLFVKCESTEEYKPEIQHELFDDTLEEYISTGREKRQIPGEDFGLSDPIYTGLSNGFVNKPEAGVGLGYQKNQFSTLVGARHAFRSPIQLGPSSAYRGRFGYRFKRSTSEDQLDDGQEAEIELLDSERQKREISPSVSAAMDRSLMNKPDGQPEFHLSNMNGGGRSLKNFGGQFGGSVGTKVWEKNGHSVGVGLGGQTIAGTHRGRPFHVQPEFGAGIGYQKGPYSVSVGAGRSYQNPFRPSNHYGVRFGYRFRRSAVDENDNDEQDDSQEAVDDIEQPDLERQKRQIYRIPVGKSTRPPKRPIGRGFSHRFRRTLLGQDDTNEYVPEEDEDLIAEPEYEVRAKRQVISNVAQMSMNKAIDPTPFARIPDRTFHDFKNFEGRATAGAGVTLRDNGRHRIGLGLAGESHIGVINGRPFMTPPRAGAGLSYQRGPVTVTLGMDHGRNHMGRRTTNWGLNFSVNPYHRG